jgi:hypothetical protein
MNSIRGGMKVKRIASEHSTGIYGIKGLSTVAKQIKVQGFAE